MKKLMTLAALSLLSLSADYHEPSITLGVDNQNSDSFYKLHLELHHQSTFHIDEYDSIILHGLSRPKSNKTCHHELGVGYRTRFEDFGFGLNLLYANQYAHSFFNHNLVPGLEIFYQHFMLAFNHYFPIKYSVEMDDKTYSFHDVSEITVSYRPSKKYEFSFTPYFNYQTKRVGYAGSASALVFDDIKLTITPYCEPSVQHGVAFSIGYHFGGAPTQDNRRLSKSHRFFYSSAAKEVKKVTPISTLICDPIPTEEPSKPIKKPESREPTFWEKVLGIEPKPSGK
jgi:hypothetical protein